MNNYIVNIFPNDIKDVEIIEKYNYTFLDIMDNDAVIKYYDLLNTLHTFKLKNIYQYLFLRSIKINKNFPDFPIMKKKAINQEIFNSQLNEYINRNQVYAIVIMNGIQQYFNPIKNI